MESRLGKYELLAEIGHGGMATVYRARDTVLGREVALKVMHPHLQGAKDARARFAREAVTIARLKHPGILEIYDYSGEDSDKSYIATELLTGPTLKQFAETHADIPAEVAACIAIPVARALSAAHAEGVIHRDVKPENVMLHQAREVKLTDFGIAQLVDMQGMTTTGQVLGSPAHMAPEQIEGRECDARSDVFSLGTVLYLLATGSLPFAGKNPHQVLKQIAEGQFRDPLQVRPQIGGRMHAILLRCLRIDPAQRYGSAHALEAELVAFVAEAGIEDPSALLREYLRDPEAFRRAFARTVIEKQTALGEQALRRGEIPLALQCWNRVLAYDEHDARVLGAIGRLGRRNRFRRVGVSAALLVLLVAAVAAVGSLRAPVRRTLASTAEGASRAARTAAPSRPAARAASSPPRATSADPGAPHEKERERARPARLPPASGNQPRHVVLRPEPANVSISIDGSLPRDFGPSFRELDLAPGTHLFRFIGAHDCCVDEEISVKVPPGPGTTLVTHQLRFRPAGLYVVSNAPANVLIDGGSTQGRTRSVIQVPQRAGMYETHEVRVVADGHQDVVRSVRLRAGHVETIEVELPKLVPPG